MKYFKTLFYFSAVFALLINLIRVFSDLAYKAVVFETAADSFVQGFVRTFFIYLFLSGIAFFMVRLLNRRLSWKQNPIGRIFIQVGVALLADFTLVFVAYMSTYYGVEASDAEVGRFFWVVSLSGFLMAASAFGFVELWFGILENRRLERSIARLEHEQIKSQYTALRQQLDPHFLFNNLNTLSSLIYVDVEKADLFIQEFSEVYRYVLRLNQEPMVAMGEELDFLESYLFLLQIRFGEHLKVECDVDPALRVTQVPPMSLQLLLENAIKHNEVSHLRPLRISVRSEGKHIVVANNLQPRHDSVRSMGIGWKSLRERYALIGAPKPTYTITDTEFIARIPLVYVTDEVRRVDH